MTILAEHCARPQSEHIGHPDDPILWRAIKAHYRRRDFKEHLEPRRIQRVEFQGKEYVILWRPGADAFLSVYRVRAYDGVLRLMKRWPQGLYRVARGGSA